MKRRMTWMRLGVAMVVAAGGCGIALGQEGNPLAQGSPYVGKFSDGKVTVELAASGEGYAGTLSVGGQQYPATASATGQGLRGTFTAGGKTYGFTAKAADGQMTLWSGGATYALVKAAGDGGNPLAGGNAQPPTGNDAKATAMGDFVVLGSTANGKTLFVKLTGAKGVASAVEATADDLGKVLDGRPELSGGFADARTGSEGGALFTGKFKGADVRGWIFCGVDKQGGGTATIVCATADADKKEIGRLFGFMPAEIKLVQHDFPDGSGSIGLPEGWTTEQQSASFGVAVKGPGGQMVIIGNSVIVNTPDGSLVKTTWQTYQIKMRTYQMEMNAYRQNVAARRQWPNIAAMQEPEEPAKPDPERDMPQLLFCPYCQGAEEVLKVFYPVVEARARRLGGAYTTLDKVMEVVPADPNPLIPGSKIGIAYIAVTDHNKETETHMRVINRIATYPIQDAKDTWVAVFDTMRSPAETFDRDLPVMNAIMASLRLNMNVVNQQIEANGAAVRKMGEDSERQLLKQAHDFNNQQAENFNRFETQEMAREKARHDSASDFIEYIGGVRKVCDSTTGEVKQVDLSNVDDVVKGMNEQANDPTRFKQIPLRQER